MATPVAFYGPYLQINTVTALIVYDVYNGAMPTMLKLLEVKI